MLQISKGIDMLLFKHRGLSVVLFGLFVVGFFYSQLIVAKSSSPLGKGEIARAGFSTAISNHEPVDVLISLGMHEREVFFFTELAFMDGRTIVHRWMHDGRVSFEETFKVEGPSWRVFSKQVLSPAQQGEWTVIVFDQESGWPLMAEALHYGVSDVLNAGNQYF